MPEQPRARLAHELAPDRRPRGAAHDRGIDVEQHLEQLLIGDSRPMRALRAAILRVGPSALAVLVTGPTGAGKELVARALHASSRRPGPLVGFNVSAVADGLFESAVFGHVRGAFTGAVSDSPGYLVEADRGTAFFDEIGALPLAAQAKLLRAVELREFRPVGAARDRRSDFRLVSATNDDIERMVRAGRFRADLAERLGGVVLEVPPLGARREDVPALVAHFAAGYAAQHGGAPGGACAGAPAEFSPGALELFQECAWPRNVRQLRHAVERALAWNPGGLVDAQAARAALPRATPPSAGAAHGHPLRRPATVRAAGVLAAGALAAAAGCTEPPSLAVADTGGMAGATTDADEPGFERRRLAAVLRACGGDTARAAAALGVSRATVYRRMARFGLGATPPAAPEAS